MKVAFVSASFLVLGLTLIHLPGWSWVVLASWGRVWPFLLDLGYVTRLPRGLVQEDGKCRCHLRTSSIPSVDEGDPSGGLEAHGVNILRRQGVLLQFSLQAMSADRDASPLPR